jgi:hypothetical protein
MNNSVQKLNFIFDCIKNNGLKCSKTFDADCPERNADNSSLAVVVSGICAACWKCGYIFVTDPLPDKRRTKTSSRIPGTDKRFVAFYDGKEWDVVDYAQFVVFIEKLLTLFDEKYDCATLDKVYELFFSVFCWMECRPSAVLTIQEMLPEAKMELERLRLFVLKKLVSEFAVRMPGNVDSLRKCIKHVAETIECKILPVSFGKGIRFVKGEDCVLLDLATLQSIALTPRRKMWETAVSVLCGRIAEDFYQNLDFTPFCPIG